MHRRKNYRKPVTTRLRASVGIATTGDVGTTGGSPDAMTVAIHEAAAVAGGVVNFVRSAEVVAAEIASVVSAAVGVVTAIAIPGRANCRSRRKASG